MVKTGRFAAERPEDVTIMGLQVRADVIICSLAAPLSRDIALCCMLQCSLLVTDTQAMLPWYLALWYLALW